MAGFSFTLAQNVDNLASTGRDRPEGEATDAGRSVRVRGPGDGSLMDR